MEKARFEIRWRTESGFFFKKRVPFEGLNLLIISKTKTCSKAQGTLAVQIAQTRDPILIKYRFSILFWDSLKRGFFHFLQTSHWLCAVDRKLWLIIFLGESVLGHSEASGGSVSLLVALLLYYLIENKYLYNLRIK